MRMPTPPDVRFPDESPFTGFPVSPAADDPLEGALRCLAAVTGFLSAAVLDLEALPRVALGVGESLEEMELEIRPGGAGESEDVWIADVSLPDPGAIRSRMPRAAALLQLARYDGPAAPRLLLVRGTAGEWTEEERRTTEAFVPLIASLVRAHGCEPDRAMQALVDSISDLAWMKDRESRFVAVNKSLATLVGQTPAQMLSRTDHDFFPTVIADDYVRGDQKVLETGRPFRSVDPIHDLDGGTRWIETIKNPVRDDNGTLVGITGVARDITGSQLLEGERRRLLEELARERDRLSDMIANVPGVVWEEMFDGSYRFVSDQVEALLGYTASEYLQAATSFLDVVHEDDRATVEVSNAEIIASRKGGSHSFRMIARGGAVVWCESHCRVILDAGGNPIGLRGVSLDVSARRAAEDRLRASEAHFRSLADVTPVMIWTTNAAGEAEFQNLRALNFLGAAEGEVTGHRWQEWIHPDDVARVSRLFRTALELKHWISFEMRYRRFDGEYRDLFVEAAPRAGDGGFAGFVGSCVDLTDRRRLEKRLEQERQLSSLGRLAGTIAHEINNVLMAIQPFADVIRRAPSNEILTRAADHITSSIERGGRITHQILRFTRASEPQCEPVAVGPWLEAISGELKSVLGPRIELCLAVPEPVCMLADPHQITQVLTNLATNARDAISGTGTLTVSASLERESPRMHAESGPFVHLVVRDNGPGLAPGVRDRLFEPLFTTRTAGTGLGLAIVRDIVLRHRGDVYVEEPGQPGAAFHVILPATNSASCGQPNESATLPPGVRRILLVEDDEMVSSAVAMLLELEGAAVLVVSRGGEALDAVRRFAPDLVVLDVGLPDVAGTVVFERLRQDFPDLPVLFSTGHAGEVEEQIGRMSGPTAHLMKPYDIATMLDTIRDLVR